MKNFAALILSITLLLALGFGFSSCKDDEPPAKPKLSFAETEISVDEDDGILEVELKLDKPYSKDLRIEYELGGTASDQDVVGTTGADYEVVGDHGVVEIESGETTGVIKLDIYGDAGFEPDETIIVSIMDTNTDEIELTADDEAEVTIKNDDEQLTASFANTTRTINEDDGIEVIQIPVQLDKPAAQNVTITYTLDGSALDSLYAFSQQPKIPRDYYDYYAKGTTTYANGITTGQIVISSGQTSGNIELQIYTDFVFENDETIEIQLTASNDAQVGTNSKMTITLEQQDGRVIALVWDDAYTDVDMDMFLWIGETADNLEGVLASAINAGVSPQQELIFVPKIVSDDISTAAFGLSCVYYSGTANPMNFEVHYVDFTDGALEAEADRDVFSATYTLNNINKWDQTGAASPAIVQTFNLTGGAYADLTDITVPTSGSRIKTHRLPAPLQRHRVGSIRPL